MSITLDKIKQSLPEDILKTIYLKNISPCKYCGDIFSDIERKKYWDFCDLGCKLAYLHNKQENNGVNDNLNSPNVENYILGYDRDITKHITKRIDFGRKGEYEYYLEYKFSYIYPEDFEEVEIRYVKMNWRNHNIILNDYEMNPDEFWLFKYDDTFILVCDWIGGSEELFDDLMNDDDVEKLEVEEVWHKIKNDHNL